MSKKMPLDEEGTPVPIPCFFFSYARKDQDAYLDQFFKDLCEAIARKGDFDLDKGEVSFRDFKNIEPGEDWESKIAVALQKSHALLCVYTTAYFRRPYCGKEFQIFVERQPWVKRSGEGQIRDSRNIVPVLWLSSKDLMRRGFPPVIVRKIQYIDTPNKDCTKHGLRKLLRKYPNLYEDLVEDLADRICDLVLLEEKLPFHAEKPILKDVKNPFSNLPLKNPSISGPKTIFIAHLKTAQSNTESNESWVPYKAETSKTIDQIIEEISIFHQHLDECAFNSFDVNLDQVSHNIISKLKEASDKNTIVLLVINPATKLDTRFKQVLKEILDNVDWKGGVLIPTAYSSNDNTHAILDIIYNSKQAIEQKNMLEIWPIKGSFKIFEESIQSMLNKLQTNVITDGPAKRISNGPDSLFKNKPGL